MASYKYGKKTSTGKDTLYTDNFIMYGSSRLGTKNAIHYDMKNAAAVKARIISLQSGISTLGDKQYEFSDHLGNVHMTISDRNKRHCDVNNDWEYNEPDILTSTDYYPGGYQMPERKWNDNSITYWNAQLGQDTVVGYFEDFSTAVKEVIATSPIDIFVNQYGGPTHNSMLYIEPAPTLGQQRVRVQSTSCTLGLWGVISVTAGVPVTIKYNVDIGTAGKINFLHGASGSTVAYTGKQTSVSGWDSVTITPTGPTLYFQLRANNCTSTYFYVNSISVRQGTTMRYTSAFNIKPLSLQLANDWQNMSGTEGGNYYASNIDVENYTGGKRVKVTVLTNIGNYGILNNVPMTVIPGKQYTFRFKVDKGNFSHINFMYGQKNPADAGYTWSGYVYTAYSNGWHEYTFTPTKSQIMVQIRPGTNGQGKYFYLEAVELLYKDGTIHYTLEQDTARYQFGFNGQLKDNEIYGEGNAYGYGDREYDPRSIRWWKVDRLQTLQPSWSPYKSFLCNPLIYNDEGGKTEYLTIIVNDEATGVSMSITLVKSSKVIKGMYVEQSTMGSDYIKARNWLDFETTYTYNIKKDGSITVSSVTKPTGYIATVTTGPFRELKAYAKFKIAVGGIDLKEGPGGKQIGGIYMVSKSGGSSPTKQQSFVSTTMYDADNLFSALGGIASGISKLPKDGKDVLGVVKFFLETVSKAISNNSVDATTSEVNTLSEPDSIEVDSPKIIRGEIGYIISENERVMIPNPKKIEKENKKENKNEK